MSTAREYANQYVNLNMGGTAQIGQLDFEEPRPIPSWLPVGGALTQYNTAYTDGQDYFGMPAACGAWNASSPLPNVLNLTRYIAAAGYLSEIGDFTYVGLSNQLELGEQTYNANHEDRWQDFITRAQSKISWLWGSLRDGGCGMIKLNSTQVAFIGTYGVYNNEAGTDERIAATGSNPETYAGFANECVMAVYYNKGSDNWYGSVDLVYPTGSQVQMFRYPVEEVLWPLTSIVWSIHYGSIGETIDKVMVPFGDGSVHNIVFQLNSVRSPYTSECAIYVPGHEITIEGYSKTWGSDTTGIGENEYERGAGAGDNDGDGDYDFGSDDVDGVDEDMFTVDAQSCGFVTVYKPTKSTLQDFAAWLYGTLPTTYGSFLDNIKKLQLNPMDGIISLNISHFNAAAGGAEPLNFYGQSSGFSAPVVSKLTHVKNCGTIYVNEIIGGWLSYGSNVNLKVYLPYCGTFSLATNEIQGGSALKLKYVIDVLTGACVAEIEVSRPQRSGLDHDDYNAPMYRFTGNVFQQVPISAVDYSGIIQGQLGLAASAASIAGGAASGNVGALAGGLSSALNAITAHPTVERVGSCGASYGYMSDQVPFLIYEFPCYNMPSKYNNFYGAPIYNYASRLGNYDGYTEIDPSTLWTDNLAEITSEEEDMLKQICSTGGIYIEHNTAYTSYTP